MKEKEDKKQNVPKRRFPGFTEPWEQRRLGDIAEFINGRAYSQDELLSEGTYPVLRVGNFYTNDSWYFSDLELEDKYYTEKGDLLYTWSATFGPHIWNGPKVIYHYHIWKVVLSDLLNKKFTVQLLEEDKAKILADKNGSTMVHITKAGMEKKKIKIPTSVEEQREIGNFLDNFDNLITLHQRKLDDLKLLKKGLLQKMFPKNGEKIPEIRFPGFTDDWEQRKLDQIAQKITLKNQDRSITETLTNSAEYGVISQGEFFDKEITNMDNISGYYVISPGDFVYNPRISNSAPCGPINRNELNRKGIMSPLYMVFSVKDVNPDYLKQFFKSTLWHRFMYLNGDTGARADRFAIKDKIFFEMPIPISKERTEQEKIGSFLNSFDTLITLHQRKLDNLKLLKKGLLQEMFV